MWFFVIVKHCESITIALINANIIEVLAVLKQGYSCKSNLGKNEKKMEQWWDSINELQIIKWHQWM